MMSKCQPGERGGLGWESMCREGDQAEVTVLRENVHTINELDLKAAYQWNTAFDKYTIHIFKPMWNIYKNYTKTVPQRK